MIGRLKCRFGHHAGHLETVTFEVDDGENRIAVSYLECHRCGHFEVLDAVDYDELRKRLLDD